MKSGLATIAAVSLWIGCSAATPASPEPPLPPPHAVVIPGVAPLSVAPPEADDADHETAPAQNRTASGITWTVIHHGSGDRHPGINDSVEVHYEGWTADGAEFDSSVKRNRPGKFALRSVIAGWTEVLQLMVAGDRWRVVVPAELAYGHVPKREGAPAGDLTFEIELLHVIAAPAVPADVAAPPPNATVTPSGLAYVVLRHGRGRSPAGNDEVEVHYSGWTTDGKMFDSSVTRGKSARFRLNGVIQGWTEALALMRAGDTFRVWIPANLAYGNTPSRPGAPAGVLVFDIELLAVRP